VLHCYHGELLHKNHAGIKNAIHETHFLESLQYQKHLSLLLVSDLDGLVFTIPGMETSVRSALTLTYETETTDYMTAFGKFVGQGTYAYTKLDDQIGVVIYKPELYRGRTGVTLHAIFDFVEGTDRAVLECEDPVFAVAEGKFCEVATPPRV